MWHLGCDYCNGEYGLPQDYGKAMELWLRAGELGYATAYSKIGYSYFHGHRGVEKDAMKAKHYWELAAMGGDVISRSNLGLLEEYEGNMNRAVKHYMIAAGAGHDGSLEEIRECFMKGHATKDEFEKALRAHKESADEMKSDQREAAAAIIAARRQN
jgi:TPR repeat protein